MEKLEKVVPRNNLIITAEYSRLVCLLVEKIKEQFKNLDLQEVKKDSINLIIFIADLVEFSIQEKLMSKKVSKKINKNELVIDVVKCLFPQLTEPEIVQFQNMLQFAIDSKLIRKKNSCYIALDILGRAYKFFKH